MCGGSVVEAAAREEYEGLSLRVRGKRPGGGGLGLGQGSIPACAGEANKRMSNEWRAKVYPRVCGGSIDNARWIHGDDGLSPRVRGKRYSNSRSALPRRSIPACAGEAGGAGASGMALWVYPRVCGGSV